MFFYISFLRPPPLQAPLFGTIQITPQIANDLRTEPFTGAQDLFYSWVPASPSPSPSTSTSSSPATGHGHGHGATKPQKLTTYRQSSAYKPIPVPLPPGVRAGQSWRLLLSAQPTGAAAATIDLTTSKDLGRVPFAVLSMPILFGSQVSGGGKQERVERVYQLRGPAGAGGNAGSRAGEGGSVALRITEQTSFDLDKKVWDSGVGLSSWLVGLAGGGVDGHVAGLREALFGLGVRSILELGAGTGIVALTLSALRSSLRSTSPTEDSPNPDPPNTSRIITTDLESAIPHLEHNIASNTSLFSGPTPAPEARVLDWDDDELPGYVQEFQGGFDAIIMADVTYNTASFPALIRTLSRLLRLGTTPTPPLVLLGYKERDPAERTLWDLARGVGLEFERVGGRAGAGGVPVEVWVGQVRPP